MPSGKYARRRNPFVRAFPSLLGATIALTAVWFYMDSSKGPETSVADLTITRTTKAPTTTSAASTTTTTPGTKKTTTTTKSKSSATTSVKSTTTLTTSVPHNRSVR